MNLIFIALLCSTFVAFATSARCGTDPKSQIYLPVTGVIGVDMLAQLLSTWGCSSWECQWDISVPLNGNVDVADLAVLLSSWSAECRSQSNPMFLEADVGIRYETAADIGDAAAWQHQHWNRMLAKMAGGICVGDIDGDDVPEVFTTRVQGADIVWRWSAEHHKFHDVTEQVSGLNDPELASLASNGCAFGDVDNDGDLDLFVTMQTGRRNKLWINNGSGGFTEEGVARGISYRYSQPTFGHNHAGTGAVFGDVDLDGHVDLLIQEWGEPHGFTERKPGNILYRNQGDGTFVDVSDSLFGRLPMYGFSGAIQDLNNDNLPDILFVGDWGTSYIFHQQPNGSFVHQALDVFSAMGLAIGDINGDLIDDIYITDINTNLTQEVKDQMALSLGAEVAFDRFTFPTAQRLWLYQDGGGLSEQASSYNLDKLGWGWGAVFLDAGNDGDLDVAAVAGFHLDLTSNGYTDVDFESPLKIWFSNGAASPMQESAQIFEAAVSQTIHSMDIDGDGLLDLLELRSIGGFRCLLQRGDYGDTRRSFVVRLRGTISNRQGLGAVVFLRNVQTGVTQRRTVGSTSKLYGHGEADARFGIGRSPTVDVAVMWPASQRLLVRMAVDADAHRSLMISEDDGGFRVWPRSVAISADVVASLWTI